jgi:hypothetical protein
MYFKPPRGGLQNDEVVSRWREQTNTNKSAEGFMQPNTETRGLQQQQCKCDCTARCGVTGTSRGNAYVICAGCYGGLRRFADVFSESRERESCYGRNVKAAAQKGAGSRICHVTTRTRSGLDVTEVYGRVYYRDANSGRESDAMAVKQMWL